MTQKHIRKILIANRGEIALRIIATAHRLGIECVSIYSPSDKSSLHVSAANESYPLPSDLPSESYLNIDKIIDIARQSEADAIHPGYGFLAENAAFSRACKEAEIIFIGPDASAIELMGDKSKAKAFAKQHKIPVIPGEENLEQSFSIFKQCAQEIGTPLLLKASAGGGGKGMKLVTDFAELESAFESAKREALSAFGDEHLIIEKYFDKARHVEVQVLADNHGNVIHLFDRDCSLQRRHQKIVEEAPAYGISDKTREAMYACAIKLCQLINYSGAGTMEFLMDDKENFYLMEMNTRLQVEHAVSEQITGVDIVEQQIHVAENKVLGISQNEISINGHSIETRIYAERCDHDFLPATGSIKGMAIPEERTDLRFEHALSINQEITSLYDPMIAKLACHGSSRKEAITKTSRALEDLHILGCQTNRAFLKQILNHEDFIKNKVFTKFIDTHKSELLNSPFHNTTKNILNILYQKSIEALNNFDKGPWYNTDYANSQTIYFSTPSEKFESTLYSHSQHLDNIHLSIESCNLAEKCVVIKFSLPLEKLSGLAEISLKKDKTSLATIDLSDTHSDFVITVNKSSTNKPKSNVTADTDYKAPLNGRVIELFIEADELVHEGDALLVMEAMKMEHIIKAKSSGRVSNIKVSENQQVSADQALLSIIPEKETRASE